MILPTTSQVKIFVGTEPIDFRNGFNGTAAVCRTKLGKNPLEGGIFAFINKRRTMIRIYFFDGHGEWSITKRVASGRFSWWKKKGINDPEIMMEHLQVILRGGDPQRVSLPPPWKCLDQ